MTTPQRVAYSSTMTFALLLAAYTLTRHPLLMDAALVVGMVGVRLWWTADAPPRGARVIWLIGAVVVVASPLHPPLRTFLGYPLMGTALIVWLGSRFSTMPLPWVNATIVNLAAFAGVSGALTLLTRVSPRLGWTAVAVVPLCTLLALNHLYKFLAERRPSRTLAPQYVGLSAFLLLLANGFGAARLHPAAPIHPEWDALTADLTLWTVAAVLLGTTNHITAALRGGSGKVTGLLPLWTVAGGLFGGALAAYSVGIADLAGDASLARGFVVLARTADWTVAVGMAFYLVGLWRRRVRFNQPSA